MSVLNRQPIVANFHANISVARLHIRNSVVADVDFVRAEVKVLDGVVTVARREEKFRRAVFCGRFVADEDIVACRAPNAVVARACRQSFFCVRSNERRISFARRDSIYAGEQHFAAADTGFRRAEIQHKFAVVVREVNARFFASVVIGKFVVNRNDRIFLRNDDFHGSIVIGSRNVHEGRVGSNAFQETATFIVIVLDNEIRAVEFEIDSVISAEINHVARVVETGCEIRDCILPGVVKHNRYAVIVCLFNLNVISARARVNLTARKSKNGIVAAAADKRRIFFGVKNPIRRFRTKIKCRIFNRLAGFLKLAVRVEEIDKIVATASVNDNSLADCKCAVVKENLARVNRRENVCVIGMEAAVRRNVVAVNSHLAAFGKNISLAAAHCDGNIFAVAVNRILAAARRNVDLSASLFNDKQLSVFKRNILLIGLICADGFNFLRATRIDNSAVDVDGLQTRRAFQSYFVRADFDNQIVAALLGSVSRSRNVQR